MSKNRDKVVLEVEVDKEYYSLIKEYSDFIDESETTVVNGLLDFMLQDYASKYNHLKQGYKKMSKINLEISQEFIESENEVFNRIGD